MPPSHFGGHFGMNEDEKSYLIHESSFTHSSNPQCKQSLLNILDVQKALLLAENKNQKADMIYE